MTSREDNIYYARLAEQGERYEDMIKYMKLVCRVNFLFAKCIDRQDKSCQTKREICYL